MVNGDRSRKLLVRSVFATGSSLAIIIGAQSLALADARQFAPENTEAAQAIPQTANLSPVVSQPEQTIPNTNVQIVQAAPSITILRQSGNPSAASINTTGQTVMQPPVASLGATPAPVIVQGQSQQSVVVVQQQSAPQQAPRQTSRSSK